MENPSVPNTGRLVDYWLGGSHYFPVDVEAAKIFESAYPDCRKFFRTLRDYIGRTVRYIESQEISQFIAFASGIPTCGNVHEIVPKAKVLYSDIDPTNIEIGKKILVDNPDADYTFCDVTNLDTLDRATVDRVLGKIQRLGIVFDGISAFLPDEMLANILDKLYDWAPEGSFLTIDFDGEAMQQYPKVIEMLDSMGTPLYMRNPAAIRPLLGRWKLTSHDILPVSAWYADLSTIPPETTEPVFLYGCVVSK